MVLTVVTKLLQIGGHKIMKDTRRQAVILRECKSPYIAQAIFILRDGISGDEGGVLADAERIVASYMGAPSAGISARCKKRGFSPTLAAGMLFFGAAMTLLAVKFFF